MTFEDWIEDEHPGCPHWRYEMYREGWDAGFNAARDLLLDIYWNIEMFPDFRKALEDTKP